MNYGSTSWVKENGEKKTPRQKKDWHLADEGCPLVYSSRLTDI